MPETEYAMSKAPIPYHRLDISSSPTSQNFEMSDALSCLQNSTESPLQVTSLRIFKRSYEKRGIALMKVFAKQLKAERLREQWAKVLPLLSAQKTGCKGRPAADHRRIINGILILSGSFLLTRVGRRIFRPWPSYYGRCLGQWHGALTTSGQPLCPDWLPSPFLISKSRWLILSRSTPIVFR